jgi:TonB family protein
MKKFSFFLFISICFHIIVFALPIKIKNEEKINQKPVILNIFYEKEKTNQKFEKKVIEKSNEIIKENSILSKTISKNEEEEIKKDEVKEVNDVKEYEIGDILGPKIKGKFSPKYPFKMKMKQIEGKVILKLLIDENGNLLKYEVLESTDNEFLNSVLNELKNVDFIPAYSDGFPIKVYGILKVHFKLD